MPREEQIEHAKNSALNTLSMVAKTRGELETRLTDKGYPDDVIAEALDRLVEVGLVNDAAYAEGYAASRQRSRGLTAGAIRRELQRKKLDTDIIDAALTQISDEDEKAKAIEMVDRKLPSTRRLDTQARIRRLASMLIRKGYSPGLAFTVVKDALAREGTALDDVDGPDLP
jgi:regulatory protein